MHLLIVADTIDATIGKAVSTDIKRVTELFSSISNYLGIKLNTNILAGKSFGKTNTESALTKLRPAPSDIVIFYYSGHGFRIPEKPRAFPNMKLKNVKTPRITAANSRALPGRFALYAVLIEIIPVIILLPVPAGSMLH